MLGLFGEYRVLLAPMAGVSDVAFRTVCRHRMFAKCLSVSDHAAREACCPDVLRSARSQRSEECKAAAVQLYTYPFRCFCGVFFHISLSFLLFTICGVLYLFALPPYYTTLLWICHLFFLHFQKSYTNCTYKSAYFRTNLQFTAQKIHGIIESNKAKIMSHFWYFLRLL